MLTLNMNKSRPIKTEGYSFSKQSARRAQRRCEAEQRESRGVTCSYGVKQCLAKADSVIAVEELFRDAQRSFQFVSGKTYRAWERTAERRIGQL